MINIRKAKKDKVEDLQELNNEVIIDNQKYDFDLDLGWAKSNQGNKYFIKLLNDPKICCLIAETNKIKVGYIVAAPKILAYHKSRLIEITNMGVRAKYRSMGIGTMLINECLKWAKLQGFQKAYVNSYLDNQMAIKFYKRSGFSEIDVSLEKNL